MAKTLREILAMASKEPNSERSKRLETAIQNGVFNKAAQEEGIDLSPFGVTVGIKPDKKEEGIGVTVGIKGDQSSQKGILEQAGEGLGKMFRGEEVQPMTNIGGYTTLPTNIPQSIAQGYVGGAGQVAKGLGQLKEAILPERKYEIVEEKVPFKQTEQTKEGGTLETYVPGLDETRQVAKYEPEKSIAERYWQGISGLGNVAQGAVSAGYAIPAGIASNIPVVGDVFKGIGKGVEALGSKAADATLQFAKDRGVDVTPELESSIRETFANTAGLAQMKLLEAYGNRNAPVSKLDKTLSPIMKKGVEPVVQAGADILKSSPKMLTDTIKAAPKVIEKSVDMIKNMTKKDPEKVLKDVSDTYNTIFNWGKSKMRKDVSNMKRDVDTGEYITTTVDPGKVLASNQIKVKVLPDGKIDKPHVLNQIWKKVEDATDTKKLYYKKQPKQFNLYELEQRAIRQVSDNKYLTGDLKEAKIKDIKRSIASEIKHNNGSSMIDSNKLETLKSNYWRNSNLDKQISKNNIPFYADLGQASKVMLEKAYEKSTNLSKLNKYEGDLLGTMKSIVNASDNPGGGGVLLKKIAQAAGAGAGSIFPVLGNIGGWYLGGKINDFMTSPERLTNKMIKKVKKAGIQPEGEQFVATEKTKIQSMPQERIERTQPVPMKLYGLEENPASKIKFKSAENKQLKPKQPLLETAWKAKISVSKVEKGLEPLLQEAKKYNVEKKTLKQYKEDYNFKKNKFKNTADALEKKYNENIKFYDEKPKIIEEYRKNFKILDKYDPADIWNKANKK